MSFSRGKFTFTKEKNERKRIFEEIVIIRIIFEGENKGRGFETCMNFSIVDQKFTFTKEKNGKKRIFEEIVIIRIIFESENRRKRIRNMYEFLDFVSLDCRSKIHFHEREKR